MDEYDYLEAQLEAPAPAQEQQQLPGPPPVVADGEAPRENGHRSSSRGKSKDRDRKRSRSRDKERRRSRERSRERRRSRSPRSRRDRDHDRYAGGGRGDRDRRRDDNRPRGPERGRDRERGPGGPPPGVRRDTTPPEVRLQREKEQELKDLERTVRTVMVMNLNLRANERDIFEHFVQVGPINDIKLICDKNTRKSKGIAYIEFGSVEAAISALTLNGQIMMNMPVLVKPSEAEKNLQWEAQQQAKQNQASAMSLLNKMGGTAPGVKANPIKLQILNLHPDVGEEDLKDLFLPFGEINYIKVVRDPAGMSTGEAYIQYADEPMANNAIHHYNGFELAGRKLLVQVAPLFTPALLPPIPGVVPLSGGAAAPSMPPMPGMLPGMALPGPPPLPPGTVLPGMPGGGVNPAAAVLASLPGPPALPDQVAATVGVGEVDDLDEAENRSFKLNAQSRAALMSRLATSAGLQAPPTFLGGTAPAPAAAAPAAPAAPVLNVPQHVLLDQGLLGPASPKPTPCLLLKNMFSDADKEDPDWQTGVAEDVRSEASKFGPVLHCHLEPNSQGHVYLKFAQPEQAEAAYKALHGRYYAGNQIVVSFQFLQPYNNFFGLK